jgi:hypothetical protein
MPQVRLGNTRLRIVKKIRVTKHRVSIDILRDNIKIVIITIVVVIISSVTVRHMYAAAVATTPDYRGLTSAISKGNARGEQTMCI